MRVGLPSLGRIGAFHPVSLSALTDEQLVVPGTDPACRRGHRLRGRRGRPARSARAGRPVPGPETTTWWDVPVAGTAGLSRARTARTARDEAGRDQRSNP
ncbi:hypothetical protein GCM10010517_71740 [Streptosporangium fragile]|uniref:Uncharacterized protein n=1 Tax=Streptosporangium fragile TaxID=46186 RepID=A0ABN3W968_9ACTN